MSKIILILRDPTQVRYSLLSHCLQTLRVAVPDIAVTISETTMKLQYPSIISHLTGSIIQAEEDDFFATYDRINKIIRNTIQKLVQNLNIPLLSHQAIEELQREIDTVVAELLIPPYTSALRRRIHRKQPVIACVLLSDGSTTQKLLSLLEHLSSFASILCLTNVPEKLQHLQSISLIKLPESTISPEQLRELFIKFSPDFIILPSTVFDKLGWKQSDVLHLPGPVIILQ